MKKTLFFFAAILITSFTLAQQKKDVKLNKETNLIEATYYYENGEISQKGTFDLAGKLHGERISYNETGDKISKGNYAKGVKTGKWIFWEEGKTKEVEFNHNVIASVIEKHGKSKVVIKD